MNWIKENKIRIIMIAVALLAVIGTVIVVTRRSGKAQTTDNNQSDVVINESSKEDVTTKKDDVIKESESTTEADKEEETIHRSDVRAVFHGAKAGTGAGCAQGAVRVSGVRLHGGLPLAVRRPFVPAGDVGALLSAAGAAHLVHPVRMRRTGPQHRPAAGCRCDHFVLAVLLLCAGHAGAGPCDGRTDLHHPQGPAARSGQNGLFHAGKARRITNARPGTVAFWPEISIIRKQHTL